MRYRVAAPVGVVLAAGLLRPAAAQAHGIVQRADLPLPQWLFGWAAALVLVVSFIALAVLWPSPRLEGETDWRPLPGGTLLGSRPVELLCGAIGAGLLPVVVLAGFLAPQSALENFATVFVLVTFWVGLVFASVLFGDVFRAFNPWRAIGRAAGWVLAQAGRAPRHRPYPETLGRWPAAVTLLVFTWIELVSGWGEAPKNLAWAAIGYSVLVLAAQAVYGVEKWTSHGEGFSAYYNLFSRLSIVETRDRVVGLRPPLSGLPRLDPITGTVPLLCVMIGTVTFDGLSQGPLWKNLSLHLVDALTGLGVSPLTAPKVVSTLGLLFGVALVSGFYWLGTEGARSVGGALTAERLRRGFIHSLVPIAAVYVAAHYFTFLLSTGQAIGYLASDPFGQGWDLFGTASSAIDYSVISSTGAWYFQVAFVIAGHVCALALAHDRALVLYSNAQLAVRSQYWMLGVMVGFTTLALWLLAQAGT